MRSPLSIPARIPLKRLAGSLAMAAGLAIAGQAGLAAHAAPAPSLPRILPFCATHHDLVSASAHNSVLEVKGFCFPYPSNVHIAIRDLTTGAVLRNWTTVPVTPFALPRNEGGRFQYVTQGDARPGNLIRFWVADGVVRIVTVTDS